jgi:hypothetical protein
MVLLDSHGIPRWSIVAATSLDEVTATRLAPLSTLSSVWRAVSRTILVRDGFQ